MPANYYTYCRELVSNRTCEWDIKMNREYTREYLVVFSAVPSFDPDNPPSGTPMTRAGDPITLAQLGSPFKAAQAVDSSVDTSGPVNDQRMIPVRGYPHPEDTDASVDKISVKPRRDYPSGYDVTVHYRVLDEPSFWLSRNPLGDDSEAPAIVRNCRGDNPLRIPPIIHRSQLKTIIVREHGQAVEYLADPTNLASALAPLGDPKFVPGADDKRQLFPFKKSDGTNWTNPTGAGTGDPPKIGLVKILNSADDEFESLPEIEVSRDVVIITRNERNVGAGYISQYLHCVNSDDWYMYGYYYDDPMLPTAPAGTAFIDSITYRQFYHPRLRDWQQVTYVVHIDPRGWNIKLVDCGLNYLSVDPTGKTSLNPILDAAGNRVVRPRSLDGTGLVLPRKDPADPNKYSKHVYRAYAVRGRRPFNPMQLFDTAPGSGPTGHGPLDAGGVPPDSTYITQF